jgi:hypothetical protein
MEGSVLHPVVRTHQEQERLIDLCKKSPVKDFVVFPLPCSSYPTAKGMHSFKLFLSNEVPKEMLMVFPTHENHLKSVLNPADFTNVHSMNEEINRRWKDCLDGRTFYPNKELCVARGSYMNKFGNLTGTIYLYMALGVQYKEKNMRVVLHNIPCLINMNGEAQHIATYLLFDDILPWRVETKSFMVPLDDTRFFPCEVISQFKRDPEHRAKTMTKRKGLVSTFHLASATSGSSKLFEFTANEEEEVPLGMTKN